MSESKCCHCEERRDAAISSISQELMQIFFSAAVNEFAKEFVEEVR
jgi:hypothetical protein